MTKVILLSMVFCLCMLKINAQHITMDAINENMAECINDHETISDQLKCLKNNYDDVDSLMNTYYTLLVKSYNLKGGNKNLRKLKKSQKLWVKMKDVHCESFYTMLAGEDQEIQKYRCLIELTVNRRNELSLFSERFRR